MALLPVFEELYDLGILLGTGASSSVFSCRERATGEEYAVKIYDLTRIQGSSEEVEHCGRIKREIQILLKLDHVGIIQPYKVYSAPGCRLYLVMELCLGGELALLLSRFHGRLSEDLTRVIMVQVVSAVGYLHSLGIAHRDLKLENILLLRPYQDGIDPQIKIVDFGFARYLSSPEPATLASTRPFSLSFLGSLPFAALEILAHQHYDCRCDMYSIGVMLYRCLVGSLPSLSNLPFRPEIEPISPIWHVLSQRAQDLISHLLTVESKRLSAAEFLSHPWCGSDHSQKMPTEQ